MAESMEPHIRIRHSHDGYFIECDKDDPAGEDLYTAAQLEQARREELDWCYAQVEALLNDSGLPIISVLSAIRARNEKGGS